HLAVAPRLRRRHGAHGVAVSRLGQREDAGVLQVVRRRVAPLVTVDRVREGTGGYGSERVALAVLTGSGRDGLDHERIGRRDGRSSGTAVGPEDRLPRIVRNELATSFVMKLARGMLGAVLTL